MKPVTFQNGEGAAANIIAPGHSLKPWGGSAESARRAPGRLSRPWLTTAGAVAEFAVSFLATAAAIAFAAQTGLFKSAPPSNRVMLGMGVAAGLITVLLRQTLRVDAAEGSRYRVQETAKALEMSLWVSLVTAPLLWALEVRSWALAGVAVLLGNALALTLERQISYTLRPVCQLHPREIAALQADRVPSAIYIWSKRAFDVIVSSLLLALFAPLLAFIAAIVRLDSPGPPIFVQERVGFRGQLFHIYKFRSMKVDVSPYAISPASLFDRRITRIGRFLRRSSLDELPQLLNVLKGDLSLVGPRPEMPFIVQEYDAAQMQRLAVLPGITGLWQINADRASQIHENLQYDMDYIRHRSLTLDAAILIHTVFFAMRGV